MSARELARLAGRRAFEADTHAPLDALVRRVCGRYQGPLVGEVTDGVLEALREYEGQLTPRGRTQYRWERRKAEGRAGR